MALELCIDSAAWILHAIDVGAPETLRGFHFRRSSPANPEADDDAKATSVRQSEFDKAVRTAASDLAYEQAQAVWLVDVCGCDYEHAAAETQSSKREVADRVRAGRHQIRQSIASPQRPRTHF